MHAFGWVGCLALIWVVFGLEVAGAEAGGAASVTDSGISDVSPLAPPELAAHLRQGGAAALAEQSLNSLEQGLFADAANGRLDDHSLLAAALIASGVHEPKLLVEYQRKFDRYARELKRDVPAGQGRRGELEAVFDFLHRRILHGGYRIDCTDLRIAIDDGRFNCVSASILFQCLAERHGFIVHTLEMPGHAMSRVILPDGPLDVETTCAAWFRLMDDPKRQAASVRQTLGATPGANRANARQVAEVGSVALVYYNRGVDLLAAARYGEAALANAKALRLDPDNRTARGNLLATVNNWAISLGQSLRFDDAVAMLQAGLAIDPQYEPFSLNYAYIRQQKGRLLSDDRPQSGAAAP